MRTAVAVSRLRLPSAATLVGLLLTLTVVAGALLAPLLTRADPLALGLDILVPPGWAHPMGTDDLGRDLFARVLYGGRVSLGIGLFSGLLSVVFGVSVGLIAGFNGGMLDEFLMRVTEIFQVMPKLLAAVERGDWTQAAAACLRHGPGPERNQWTRQQFLSAVIGAIQAEAEMWWKRLVWGLIGWAASVLERGR